MTGLTLTPRQARIGLNLFTGAMVVSVAVALAGLTWRIAGHAGTGAITVPSGASGPAVAPDIGAAVALAPFGKPSVSEAGQATSLPLELKGVIAAGPGELSSAFISISGQPAKAYKVGDNINGATIQSILRDRVILANGGRNEFLAFPDPTLTPEQRQAAAQGQPAPAPANPVTAPPGAPPIRTVPGAPPPPAGPPQASVGSILQRFDASPVQGGYRIGDNGPPGMVAGDVIQSVNGTSLSDPAAAQGAFAAAQANGTAQIQILRDGKRITLAVPLR
ncbi:general secretion pathway protein C [Sphingomonas kyeonggiensis]|uniref:General secretion pathway protein C n=1 Tax=Sphingomonas kyeonggiensis TaxID=1268553 RepID=A0A7W7K3Q1_9SPHN|nr:type II secretion system protein N [Sphingomonas kyeonggiensis]MBB4840081.1 general secretion pathway protein C [Sphingomonas kyeonggiensis]